MPLVRAERCSCHSGARCLGCGCSSPPLRWRRLNTIPVRAGAGDTAGPEERHNCLRRFTRGTGCTTGEPPDALVSSRFSAYSPWWSSRPAVTGKRHFQPPPPGHRLPPPRQLPFRQPNLSQPLPLLINLRLRTRAPPRRLWPRQSPSSQPPPRQRNRVPPHRRWAGRQPRHPGSHRRPPAGL